VIVLLDGTGSICARWSPKQQILWNGIKEEEEVYWQGMMIIGAVSSVFESFALAEVRRTGYDNQVCQALAKEIYYAKIRGTYCRWDSVVGVRSFVGLWR
jgi:hypothetical protein